MTFCKISFTVIGTGFVFEYADVWGFLQKGGCGTPPETALGDEGCHACVRAAYGVCAVAEHQYAYIDTSLEYIICVKTDALIHAHACTRMQVCARTHSDVCVMYIECMDACAHRCSVRRSWQRHILCHIIIHTMSHHHTYYVTSSYILCMCAHRCSMRRSWQRRSSNLLMTVAIFSYFSKTRNSGARERLRR